MSKAAFAVGKYKARIVNWGLGESKEKKTPYVGFTIEPMGQIDSVNPVGDLIRCPQFQRTIFLYLTDNTMEQVVRDLRALGYTSDSFDQLEADHPQAFSFKDKEVVVECKHEDYKGEAKEKWEFTFGRGNSIAKLDKQGVRRLNALFGKALKPTASPGPAASAGASNGGNTAVMDQTPTPDGPDEVF